MSFHLRLNHNSEYEPWFYSESKYVSIAGGRRTGKTWEARNWILDSLISRENSSGLWFDTIQGNIEKYVQRYFRPVLKPLWDTLVTWDRQKQILHLPNDSYLDFASAQKPENAEGFAYDYVMVNEAGIIFKKPEIWLNTLQPMTKDAIGVRFVGTPKGRNQFFNLYQQGEQGLSGYESHRLPAWESKYWEQSQLDQIKDTTPVHIFNQEYGADFIEGDSAVFVGLAGVIDPNLPKLLRGEPGKRYVMGVDLAKHTDFTVITVLDTNGNQVYFERFNQLEWVFQKQKIYTVWEMFNGPQTYLDSTGIGDPIYDDLNRTKMNGKLQGYKLTNATKKDLIENLIVCVSSQSIRIPDIQEEISELTSFEYNITRAGLLTYGAPIGLHDDCVISLALAAWGTKNPANDFSFVFASI